VLADQGYAILVDQGVSGQIAATCSCYSQPTLLTTCSRAAITCVAAQTMPFLRDSLVKLSL
jgi:hypothetical protein